VHAGTGLAVALAAGIIAQSLGRHLRFPGIVLLLLFGAGLGPDGLGWVEPEALGEGLFTLVDFAVAIILFEGGLNLEWSRLRRLEAPLRGLLTVGPIVTWGGAALAARFFLDWSWPLALLFGSLVIVTGPTVVAPLAREVRLRARIKTVLEAEGVLIDPIGAFLAVLALQVVLSPTAGTLGSALADVGVRLASGVGLGLVAGYCLAALLGRRNLVPHGLENVFTLSAVVLLFESTNLVAEHAGLMAVPVAGVIVGNSNTRVDRDLREFKDQLTVLLVGMLFVLLAADVSLDTIRGLGIPGLLTVAALVFIVRPLSVWLSTLGSKLAWQDRLFAAWIAPRGIVAAAVASLVAVALEEHGIEGGIEIRALVFLTIGVTVVLAGVTAAPLASLLDLRIAKREGVAIYGAGGLGLALGAELVASKLPVVFIDNDPRACARAEAAGHRVVYGDPLVERTLLRAGIDEIGTAVGLTNNDHLNTVFAAQAHDLFGVPESYVAQGDVSGTLAPEHVDRFSGRVLFEGPHDKQRWEVRARIGEMEVLRFQYLGQDKAADDTAADDKAADDNNETDSGSGQTSGKAPTDLPVLWGQPGQEQFVLLTCLRGKKAKPVVRGYRPKVDDVVTAAVYSNERAAALEFLTGAGWTLLEPVPVENPPAS
jgi:NhaP-type Na+/H+ or K+/H+ antiporter